MALSATAPGTASLRANFSWTLAGNVVYNGCQWGMLVVLAKLGSPEILGRFSLAFALSTPLFMLSSLSLATLQGTDARDEFSYGQYFGLRLVTSAAAFVPLLVVLAWRSYGWETSAAILLVAAAKAAESCSDVTYGLFQKHERMELPARSLIIKGVLSLAAVMVAMVIWRSLVAAMIGLAVVWFGVYRLFDRRNGRRFAPQAPSFDWRVLGHLAAIAWPLGVVAGLGSLTQQAPRLFLAEAHGERELGLFAAVAGVANAGNLISIALSRSAAPRLAKLLTEGRIGPFKALLSRLMLLGAGVGIVGAAAAITLGRPFLAFVYGPVYAERNDVLVWTMVSIGVVATGTFLGAAATAARQLKVQMVIHIAKLAMIAAVCVLTVPRYASLGAAWALVVANTFSVLAFMVVVSRALRRPEVARPDGAAA